MGRKKRSRFQCDLAQSVMTVHTVVFASYVLNVIQPAYRGHLPIKNTFCLAVSRNID